MRHLYIYMTMIMSVHAALIICLITLVWKPMLCHIVPHAWAHMSQEGATWSHVSAVGPIVASL